MKVRIIYGTVAYIEVPNRNLFYYLQDNLTILCNGDFNITYNADLLEMDIEAMEESPRVYVDILSFLKDVQRNLKDGVGDIIFNRP